MTGEAYKALAMLNAFASVGAQRFDITFTDLDGKKLEKGGYLPNRHINGIRSAVSHILRRAAEQQHNFILRPRPSERAELIQLDDLNAEQARKFEHRAFMTLCTSPGNYQAWVAVSDPEPDFARRLRKGAGADGSASGATRVSGSRNFKRKYGPDSETARSGDFIFPMVEITGSNPGLTQTRAELETAGLVAAKETATAAIAATNAIVSYDTRRPAKRWPSYEICVKNAPPVHGGDERPDISKADFVWCMTAINWGHGIEDTAKMLMEHSAKARENGEFYATRTAGNAAQAVDRRKGRETGR